MTPVWTQWKNDVLHYGKASRMFVSLTLSSSNKSS